MIKTHKSGPKLRVITAGTNSTVAQLSAFTERFLGPIARSLRYILVDTTDFLRMLQEINKRFGSIPDHFLLVSWDIEAMYPSIHNALGMEACRKALDNREKLKPSTDSIMEAVELILENNNSTFNGKHYLQIDGTAMGPKNACSYADIVYLISTIKFLNTNTSSLCAGAAAGTIALAYGMDHWKNVRYLHLIYRLSVHLSNLLFSTIVIGLNFGCFSRKGKWPPRNHGLQ